MPAKKDRKNAKHSGGIAAAVTKQTAGKFARPVNDGDESGNDSSKSIPTSNASSPPINTPEIRPSAAPDNENPEPSPSLDALSTTSVSASTAPSVIHDWARNRMAASPSNLIALASESPPTQPSSYEDPSHLHHGWSAQRAFMTPSPASPSPPTSHSKRPLSYQMDPHFVSPDSMPRASSTALHQRRSSVNSPAMYPHGHSRMGSHPPPLPHQPQAHFYGVSDLDLTIKPQSGMKPGDQGLYFGFDKLPSPYSATGSENVVLAGYQGGLEVYGVSKRGLEPMASLKGLRGGVHYAKILPWTVGGDKDGIFPLVALVVHGPVIPRRSPATPDEEEDDSTAKKADGAASPRSPYIHHDAFSTRNGQKGQVIEAYQTTVEVYSLKTNKLVDVLLQAPTIPISTEVSITSPIFQPPLPTGAFVIKADAGTVAVCSGSTGECWVYTQLLQAQNGHLFACTAKLWTCIQPGQRGSDVPEESDKMNPLGATRRPNPPTAIFALNGRKIAYCPAAPSSSIAIRAHLPVPILGRGAGITSVTPPHLPSVTASVDLPISDSVVNKVMREATQELIQGAKWVGQQGLQAWNSYWNRATSPQSQQQQPWSPPQQWNGTRSPLTDGAAFPPTHGTSGQAAAATKDSGLVSILDVDSLALSPSIHPSATFLTPLGCSFLSFSPSSLSLFTASSKGDVQTVWDLFRVQHTHSSPLQASMVTHDSTGPQVRQIAQFSRMTVARIIDVVWMEPQGERLAMVTERGTVHLLDMPFSAFMWPPPRRRKVTPKPAAEPSEPSSSAVSLASGAFGAAYQVAMPFVTRSRQGSGNSASTAGSILKDSAAQGGRAIAASITSSIGKTGSAISQLRHTGENRLSLPPSSSLPSSSCVIWIKGRRSATLFNLGGGLVRTYPYKSRRQSGGKRVSRVNRYTDYQLPLLPDDNVAPAVRQILDLGTQEEYLDLSDTEMDIGTTLTLKGRPRAVSNNTLHTMAETIPQAEIECSAPYQPFHTDRRVVLCEYTPAYGSQIDGVSEVLANSSLEAKAPSSKKSKNGQHLAVNMPSSNADGSAWAFGQDISVVKLDLGLPTAFEDEYDDPEDHRPLPPSAMERVMEFGDSEQIVVTTRRRRGAHQGDPDGDGFFEDDCEVLDFADQRV